MQGSVSQNDLSVNSDYDEAFTHRRNPVQRSYSTPARPRPLQFSRPQHYLASSKPDLSPTVELDPPENPGDPPPESRERSIAPSETRSIQDSPTQVAQNSASNSTYYSADASTQTLTPQDMKLRGPYKVSRAKTIPFLLTAVFLLLLGLALVLVGLLIEFHWKYDMEVFYKPWWTGGLVTIAGLFVSMFCCLRTPAVAVVVTTVCLPALASSILQLILSGLMADALTPDEKTFFCSSKLMDSNTLYCKCNEDISFNITVKGEVPSSTTSAFCEDEMEFIFEIMLAVAGVCGLLIVLLFPYIMWAYCTVTRPTYAEKRTSMIFNGTMTRSGTLLQIQGGTINSPLVLTNTMNRSQRPSSRAQSVHSAGFRPIVTVQRAQSMATYQTPPIGNGTGTMRSKSGTLKSIKAPHPPKTETMREETSGEPIYNNIEQDPIRAAEQHRFEIPSDIQGIKPSNNHRQSLSTTPIQVAKLHRKPARNSLAEDDDGNDSSDDNTTDVVHNFKSSPKQLNATPDGKIQNLNSNLDIAEYAKT